MRSKEAKHRAYKKYRAKHKIKINLQQAKAAKRRYTVHRDYFIKKKGGKCNICNIAYDYCCFDFHHLVSNPKEKKPNYWFHSIKWLDVYLKNCILVCSNCHRSIHDKQRRNKY